MEAKNKIKQRKETRQKQKQKQKKSTPMSNSSNIQGYIKFSQQEQLSHASCCMLRNKDIYNVGKHNFPHSKYFMLSKQIMDNLLFLFSTTWALILACLWCLIWHAKQGSLKIIFTVTPGAVLQAYCWPIES